MSIHKQVKELFDVIQERALDFWSRGTGHRKKLGHDLVAAKLVLPDDYATNDGSPLGL